MFSRRPANARGDTAIIITAIDLRLWLLKSRYMQISPTDDATAAMAATADEHRSTPIREQSAETVRRNVYTTLAAPCGRRIDLLSFPGSKIKK